MRALGHVLVTGAAGFLGEAIAGAFAEEGSPVTRLARAGSASNLHVAPITDWTAAIARSRPDTVIHCAGASSVASSMDDPAADFASGPVLTFDLLNALRLHVPECRFIFCSSAAIYGDPAALPVSEDHPPAPLSPYGFHKLQSEAICREFTTLYGMPTAALRIFSAYGAGLRRQVVWDIACKIAGGEPVSLRGTGYESRDFVHASDVAAAARIVAAHAPMAGEAYNVASGHETSIADLANRIVALSGRETSVRFDGIATPGNPHRWRADVGRLTALGFRAATPFDAGLAAVLQAAAAG